MRILCISSSSNRSGGVRQACYQADELAARGHEVTLWLPHDSEFLTLPPSEQSPLWRALPHKSRDWAAALEPLLPPASSAGSAPMPTVIHAFHNKAVKWLAWHGLFWMRRGVVAVAHRGVIFRPGNPLPYLSPAMRAFLPNSKACARALRFHCPPCKIQVIPNGVPDSRVTPSRPAAAVRAELGLAADALVFVSVGNDNPVKGSEILLRAFAQARAAAPTDFAGARLLMVGSTAARWQSVCDSLGLADQVMLLGPREQVADYLQLADAFIFPSWHMDSAPNTLLEALRLGLPVVASAVGGVPEIMDGNGLSVPPQDVQALAQALCGMAQDPARRTLWAQRSRELGAGYSIQARCDALEAVYRCLLGI